jgi:Histone-fold protein
MKSNINRKILRLVSTEVLLQIGFEKTTEQSLNIITEVFAYYMESLIKKAAVLQGCDGRNLCKILIADTYRSEQYQLGELSQFLDQQNLIKRQLREKAEGEEDSCSLLHSLKVLPQGMSLKSTFKNTKSTTIEEKSNREIFIEIKLDDFLNQFIEESYKSENRRQLVKKINGSKILDKIVLDHKKEPEVRLDNKLEDRKAARTSEVKEEIGKKMRVNYKEDIIMEQQYFVEDFSGIERYKTFKS